MVALPDPLAGGKSRSFLLAALIVALAMSSASLLPHLRYQVAGADFSCFWAGARAALQDPSRLYDFQYVTNLQGWPLGPDKLRPFIYPPSALFLFMPFGLAPYWPAYGLWVVATASLFLWVGLKAGSPWWLMLLQPVAYVIYCGQITLLFAALVIGGVAMLPRRPLWAGVLFGIAAAVKPQLMLLVPIALLAEGRWRTLATAGLTGGALVAASAIVWGVQPWFAWISALQRFQGVIFNDPRLVEAAITPYAALQTQGWNGAWAFLLAPLVLGFVWSTFRRSADVADRSIAVLAGGLLISPYAMNYEAALLAPAVAAYLARTDDRLWLVYAAVSFVYVYAYAASPLGVLAVLAVVALPFLRRVQARKSAV